MLAVGHEPARERESLEIESFRGKQRITDEVRDDPLDELVEGACLPLQRRIAAVRPDASAPEVGLQRMEHLSPIAVLADGEAGSDLPSHRERRPRSDRDREATFSIGVAGDVGREELATDQRAGV